MRKKFFDPFRIFVVEDEIQDAIIKFREAELPIKLSEPILGADAETSLSIDVK
jgi:hypothetical protein